MPCRGSLVSSLVSFVRTHHVYDTASVIHPSNAVSCSSEFFVLCDEIYFVLGLVASRSKLSEAAAATACACNHTIAII